MDKEVIFHYERESYGRVIVSKDENVTDTPEDLLLLGKIVGFDGSDFSLTENSKREIKDILSRNDIVSIPLFYTPKGIYTKSQLEERFSGCIYITYDEIKSWLTIDSVTEDVIDEVILELMTTVEFYESQLSGRVYKYTIYDENNDEVESIGSFYDLDQCIEEAERHFASSVEDKNEYRLK